MLTGLHKRPSPTMASGAVIVHMTSRDGPCLAQQQSHSQSVKHTLLLSRQCLHLTAIPCSKHSLGDVCHGVSLQSGAYEGTCIHELVKVNAMMYAKPRQHVYDILCCYIPCNSGLKSNITA